MKVQSRDRRVQKLLDRQLTAPAYRWGDVTDPRAKRGRRWSLSELCNAALLGLLSNCPSLRDLEGLTDDLGPTGRQYVAKRVPDTTLWDLLPRLSVQELRAKLCQQVKAAWRRKSLTPVGLPCGVLAIDGKGLGALEHDAEGTAQKGLRSHDGSPYWLARMLRAVLTSAEARPCLDQLPIGAKTNEMGDFPRLWQLIVEAYGKNNDLFEIVTVDAGLTSRGNADLIHEAHKAYVMAIKGPQPELLAEAERLLGRRRKPDAETPWERAKGKRIQRQLFRTDEMAGYHGWTHLRQAWRVLQVTEAADGTVEREERYFVTSVPWGRLSPNQVLAVVRGHWGVENDCFWTLDVQWLEDSVPWCSSGRAVEVLSWLRLMAYNLVQSARRRHLRLRRADGTLEPPPPWRRVFAWVRQAWQLAPDPVPGDEPVCG